MSAVRKSTGGFFDLFPNYFKVAVAAMGAVTVLGAGGLAVYQFGLARPAAEIAQEPVVYEGIQVVDGPVEAGQTQPEEEKTAQGSEAQNAGEKTKPVFGAGSYTVTTPSGLNVRYGADIASERTGGKVWGSGVKIIETKLVDGDTWGKLAGGGWIAMEYDGDAYVVSDKEVR